MIAIVDKTADVVARIGPQFEDVIREKEKGNTKFAFMNPHDPYHNYYQHRIKEAGEDKVSEETTKNEESSQQPANDKSNIGDNGETIEAPPEPPALEFLANTPSVSQQDLDIVKLTALFVARNGRGFMDALSNRESRNYQFDFLRPSHSLFSYFNTLVDQYTKVLLPPVSLKAKLVKRATADNSDLMEGLMLRTDYDEYMAEVVRKAEAEADEERMAVATIDWHDFVVVATIEFVASDLQSPLAPPTSLLDLKSMTLEQKKLVLSLQPTLEAADVVGNEEDEVEMQQSDDEMQIDDEDAEFSAKPKDEVTLLHEQAQPTNIRTDYVPKVGKQAKKAQANEVFLFNGVQVKASEMTEHMRVELLDPKWKEQKAAYIAKHKESNLVAGVDVSQNLSKLSTFRTDIFGSSDDVEFLKKVDEDAEKARKAEKRKVIWDGHTSSIPSAAQKMQQVNIEQMMNPEPAKPQPPIVGPQVPTSTPALPQDPSNTYGQYHLIPPPLGIAFPPGVPPPPFLFPGQLAPPGILPTAAVPLLPPGQAQSLTSGDRDSDHPAKRAKAEVTLIISTNKGDLNAQPISLDSTVSAFKEHISKLVGLAASKQKLIHPDGSTVLKNSLSLKSYKLQDGQKLVLATRNK